mgnify:CR=1 FL=1
MRKIFAVLLLIGSSTFTYSQITISGVVLDSITQEPLSLALVSIKNSQILTNEQGGFSIANLTKGLHLLTITHIGCENRRYQLSLERDTTIAFFLPHHLHTFDEVISYGHRNNSEPGTHLIQRINHSKLEKIAAITLSDALQESNGVNFLKTGASIAKPVINGMHSNRISVINDDSKQEGQQWGIEHAPEIDPLSAGTIEVIKGAYTLSFGGDAMGGIIRLLPAPFDDTSYTKVVLMAKGETNPRGGQIGVKLENYNAIKSWSQRLIINAKRNGDAKAPGYVLSNSGFGQLSGSYYSLFDTENSQISFSATGFVQQLGILSTSHIGNLTDLNRALASDTPLRVNPFTFTVGSPSQFIRHYSSKIKWSTDHKTFGKISSSYTIQNNHRQEFDSHNGGSNSALDLNLWTQQLNVIVDKHLHDFRWHYGLSGEYQSNVGNGRYFIPNYFRYKSGAFAVATVEKEKHLVEGGIRYDWQLTDAFLYENKALVNNQLYFQGLSANVSGWRAVSEDVKIHVSLATRYRNPGINELFSNGLHHGSAALEFGDIDLKQERSYSANTAVFYNHNRVRIQLEPYFYYFNDYIYLKPSGETQLTIRGAFPVFNYVQTNATYTGTDFDLRYRLSDQLTAIGKTSLILVKDVKNKTYIYGIPAQQFNARIKYTFAKMLNVHNGHLWLNGRYTAKQKNVEPNEDFADTPEAYFLLNLEFGGQIMEGPLHFNFGVRNLLNTTYRDYMNRYRYFADDIGINTYITINYKFK